MRKILVIILILAAAGSSFGLPLVFKSTKEIKTNGKDFTEIVSFDVAKYKELRVGVISATWKISDDSNVIRIEAVENEDLIFLQGFEIFPSRSVSIESPPNKIRISARESGTYKIFIWAQ